MVWTLGAARCRTWQASVVNLRRCYAAMQKKPFSTNVRHCQLSLLNRTNFSAHFVSQSNINSVNILSPCVSHDTSVYTAMERKFPRNIVLIQPCVMNHLITSIFKFLSFLISSLQDFDSQLERDDNHSAKNFSDIITISILSLVTKYANTYKWLQNWNPTFKAVILTFKRQVTFHT